MKNDLFDNSDVITHIEKLIDCSSMGSDDLQIKKRLNSVQVLLLAVSAFSRNRGFAASVCIFITDQSHRAEYTICYWLNKNRLDHKIDFYKYANNNYYLLSRW
ncbi:MULTISPECIES: hypothetical protein [Acinetobacter]|uniref:hypothetical protein n=1 Tax=Acinetobacter TaxID=469 RepID=UPI0004D5D23B|nr:MULTISPECIES: hypothetical protein [unclassified Acinetobacter]KEC84426.1 hypothetical protein DT74_08715 [Acinetobacter sp. ETR1]WEE40383.1 hypothetical protein PYV58_04310 [Acinetobacter sp. TAC-1]